MLVVGVTADTTARFDRAVRWPPGELDPRHQFWVAVALPPGYGYPNLYDVRGGREVTVAYPLAAAQGFRGSRLVAFGLNTSLAYDRRYHVGATRLGIRLQTRPAPTAFVRRSWTFHSVEAAEREVFLDAVRRAPARLRALLAQLDGAVDVVGGSEACISVDACEEVEGDRAKVGIASSASARGDPPRARSRGLRSRARRARPPGVSLGFHPNGLEERAVRSTLGAVRRPARALGARRASDDPRWMPRAEFVRLLREHAALPPALGTWPAASLTYSDSRAEVAELADAPDSKSGAREGVWVRFPPSASRHGSQRISTPQAGFARRGFRARLASSEEGGSRG